MLLFCGQFYVAYSAFGRQENCSPVFNQYLCVCRFESETFLIFCDFFCVFADILVFVVIEIKFFKNFELLRRNFLDCETFVLHQAFDNFPQNKKHFNLFSPAKCLFPCLVYDFHHFAGSLKVPKCLMLRFSFMSKISLLCRVLLQKGKINEFYQINTEGNFHHADSNEF